MVFDRARRTGLLQYAYPFREPRYRTPVVSVSYPSLRILPAGRRREASDRVAPRSISGPVTPNQRKTTVPLYVVKPKDPAKAEKTQPRLFKADRPAKVKEKLLEEVTIERADPEEAYRLGVEHSVKVEDA